MLYPGICRYVMLQKAAGVTHLCNSEQNNADDCKVSCKRLAQCRMWSFDGQICRLYNHLRDFDQDFERAHNSTAGCLLGYIKFLDDFDRKFLSNSGNHQILNEKSRLNTFTA